MEHSTAQRKPEEAADLAGLAWRQPGRLVGWLIGLHLVGWTLLPVLLYRNLQIDFAEGLALGKEWQLGYWKHPPLPWWIDDLVVSATGDVRALYLLGPVASVTALWAVWRLGLRVTSPVAALIAVVALEGLHFFNFTAVKFNHDVMQLPLWALTGLIVYQAITLGRSRDWALAGVVLAAAFWTKYSTVVLAAAIGLALLIDPFARRAWRTPGPYVMAGVLLLLLGPHLWWLVAHDFQPLQYAEVRAHTADRWYQWMLFPLQWIASQLFFLLPTLMILALALRGSRRRDPAADPAQAFARRYVAVLALAPFALVTIGAGVLGRLPVAMWGYPLWTFLPLAAVTWFVPVLDPHRRRRLAHAAVAVLIAFPVAYAADELFEPFVRDRPKATQFPGRELAATITRSWRAATGMPLVYVGGADFVASGAGEFAANNVAVYSPDHPHVIVHGNPAYSPWIDRADVERRGAVFIWEPRDPAEGTPDNIKSTFPRAELQPPLTLPRQTLYRRTPATVRYALLRPQPGR